MIDYNPWQGCEKYSEGCKNCYLFALNNKSKIEITTDIDLPIQKKNSDEYVYPSDTVFLTCNASDFFLPEMKELRKRVIDIIKERSDCKFIIITKRIDLVDIEIPDNVELFCSCENQKQYDYRMPIFKTIPAKHKSLIFEPLISHINLGNLHKIKIDRIIAGGEFGNNKTIRTCYESWIRDLYNQAHEICIPFSLKQTGSVFERIDEYESYIMFPEQFSEAKRLGYQDFSGF